MGDNAEDIGFYRHSTEPSRNWMRVAILTFDDNTGSTKTILVL